MNEPFKPTVGEMLRHTGANTASFMDQVADHIDRMEAEVVRLTARVAELEAAETSDAK